MKIRIACMLVTIAVIAGCGMAQVQNGWSPYIGCSETELLMQWGRGQQSTLYTRYGTTKTIWYHRNLLFGGVFPGYTSADFNLNILIHITDGKITAIGYH